RALDLLERGSDPCFQALVLGYKAALAAQQGHLAEASRDLARGESLLAATSSPDGWEVRVALDLQRGGLECAESNSLAERGEVEAAARCRQAAAERLDRARRPSEEVFTGIEPGLALVGQSDLVRFAAKTLARALDGQGTGESTAVTS